MSKWKCEICGAEFENFHAQGFDNKIYCPLCYFKKENQELKETIGKISKIVYEIKELTETTNGYPSDYIDNLLEILKEVE